MHLPSESLNGAICPVTAAVAAGAIVLAAYTLNKKPWKRPALWHFTLTTTAVFAMQALNYALPAGFSGHMLGAVFAASGCDIVCSTGDNGAMSGIQRRRDAATGG